jgi:hypothetical protein
MPEGQFSSSTRLVHSCVDSVVFTQVVTPESNVHSDPGGTGTGGVAEADAGSTIATAAATATTAHNGIFMATPFWLLACAGMLLASGRRDKGVNPGISPSL